MLTRPFVKKRRTNYFGFGKKGLQKKETLQKTKRHFFFFYYWHKAFKHAAKKLINNENKKS